MPQIRPLAFDDSLEALTALLHAAYASLAAQGWNFTAVDQSVTMTRERLATAQGFVAEHDGRLVGTVAVSGPKAADARYLADPAPPLYCEPGTALIAQLAVHPDCRGQGLAERLLDVAEAWALAQGYACAALDTAEPALDLQRRYLRRGYRAVGHVQWTGKTYRSVLMSKRLETP
jgi:GNAT superfamily N-acetyltransferase